MTVLLVVLGALCVLVAILLHSRPARKAVYFLGFEDGYRAARLEERFRENAYH